MPNIEYLDLTKNNIDKISDSSIDNCFNLRILNLAYNLIKNLKYIQTHIV